MRYTATASKFTQLRQTNILVKRIVSTFEWLQTGSNRWQLDLKTEKVPIYVSW